MALLSHNKEKLPEFDESGLFNTRATLGTVSCRVLGIRANSTIVVVCPNHLAQQWADEIKKYTDLKVQMYTTLEDIKGLTYGDIASAGTIQILLVMG